MKPKEEGRAVFGWDLCKECNYRCPYCGVWKESRAAAALPPERWGEIWDRIGERHGSCHIYVSGGEPSVYPGFAELMRRLVGRHTIEICTNLSWDVEPLIAAIPPGRMRIAPTFHPSFADFEEFLRKAVRVKDYLPDGQVYYVAHPGQIREMPERGRRLQEHGISLIPLPLRGDGYVLNSEEEKRIVEDLSPYRGEKIKYQLQELSPKGRLCRAGQRYAVVRADGRVDRCSQYQGGEVGSILDDDFRLFPEPRPCGRDYCPIESQWIVEIDGARGKC